MLLLPGKPAGPNRFSTTFISHHTGQESSRRSPHSFSGTRKAAKPHRFPTSCSNHQTGFFQFVSQIGSWANYITPHRGLGTPLTSPPINFPAKTSHRLAIRATTTALNQFSNGSGLVTRLTSWPVRGYPSYVNCMLHIYNRVAPMGTQNFKGARIRVPTNLHIDKWRSLATTPYHHQVVELLQFRFPIRSQRPAPTPSCHNHPSARDHPWDVTTYICTEIQYGAILGPFAHQPFQIWCQTSPFMTRPKKGTSSRWIIVNLSWPYPPEASVNGGTPRDSSLGAHKKMHLPTASYFTDNMCKARKGAGLYNADIACPYRQLPLGLSSVS